MKEIPKIVRERLEAGPVSITHPDADVLTALSERSLSEGERTTVLDHLSHCAECREIVALALPASEPLQALPRARSRVWLSWPVFRWGFASAGLAAIAVFGFVQYQHHERQMATYQAPKSASLEAKSEPLPKTLSEDKLVARQDSKLEDAERDVRKSKVAPNFTSPAMAPSPSAKQSLVLNGPARSRNALPHGPMQSNQWQQQNSLANQAPTAVPAAPEVNGVSGKAAGGAPAPPSQMVTVQSAAPAIDTRVQDLSTLVVKNQSLADLQPHGGHAEAEVEKAKPVIGAGPRKIVAQTDHLESYGYVTGLPANTPRWTINSSGGLQRSFDQGVTWQNVSVANSPVAPGGTTLELSAAPARAKENESLKKAKKDESAPPTFRTVVANGADVWAGGANGLLYHSTDAGAHWVRIVPSATGAVLTGDVLTMEFPDPHQGKIVTSTGETWLTSDGGLTWQKQ